MKVISTEKAPQAIGPYSQAIVIGNLLYTSGQIPLTPEGAMVEGTIVEQTHQVMANLKAVLEASNSSFQSVVKTTVFIKDMNDFQAFNEVYGQYFDTHKPARSTVEVARLPKDARVEIELIAVIQE